VGCSVILNQYVQFGIAGVEIGFSVATGYTEEGAAFAVRRAIEGALKLAGSVGLGHLLGSLIDSAIADYSGRNFSPKSTNEKLYNDTRVGTSYLNEVASRQQNYGAPMKPADARAKQQAAMADIREENSKLPFTQRYFAISNPYSLVSLLSVYIPSGTTNMATSFKSSLASLVTAPQKIFASIGNLIMPHTSVYAANAMDIEDGVEKWDWTIAEDNLVDRSSAFLPEKLDDFVIAKYDALEVKYNKCYTYTYQIDRPADCTTEYLTTDEARKWRAFKVEGSYAELNARIK
jgi:hypothetical protein